MDYLSSASFLDSPGVGDSYVPVPRWYRNLKWGNRDPRVKPPARNASRSKKRESEEALATPSVVCKVVESFNFAKSFGFPVTFQPWISVELVSGSAADTLDLLKTVLSKLPSAFEIAFGAAEARMLAAATDLNISAEKYADLEERSKRLHRQFNPTPYTDLKSFDLARRVENEAVQELLKNNTQLGRTKAGRPYFRLRFEAGDSGNPDFWNRYFDQATAALKVIQYWVEKNAPNKIATTETFLKTSSGYPDEVVIGYYGDMKAREEKAASWWEQWRNADTAPDFED